MNAGPGMGMSLPIFLAMWIGMMAAMMFPSLAPVALLWIRSIGRTPGGAGRTRRTASFVTGYLLAWACYGVIAFGALAGADRLVAATPGGARWVGAGLLGAAGLYQLTPLKDVCLRGCRSPLGLFLHYGSFRGAAVDLRVGLHHGLSCVGCCWGLMAVLLVVGVMNLPAMVALAIVVSLEKLWRHGAVFARAVGVALLAMAALAPFHPWLMPGLRASRMM